MTRRAAILALGALALSGCSRTIGALPGAASSTEPRDTGAASVSPLKTASIEPGAGGYGNLGRPELMYSSFTDKGFT
jgi:hypothetical protein